MLNEVSCLCLTVSAHMHDLQLLFLAQPKSQSLHKPYPSIYNQVTPIKCKFHKKKLGEISGSSEHVKYQKTTPKIVLQPSTLASL